MKKILIMFLIFIIPFIMVGCNNENNPVNEPIKKYIHYSAEDNGKIKQLNSNWAAINDNKLCNESDLCDLNCSNKSYFLDLTNIESSEIQLIFKAVPDEGYQVKDWKVDGKIVEKESSIYSLTILNDVAYSMTIIVSFEKIPNYEEITNVYDDYKKVLRVVGIDYVGIEPIEHTLYDRIDETSEKKIFLYEMKIDPTNVEFIAGYLATIYDENNEEKSELIWCHFSNLEDMRKYIEHRDVIYSGAIFDSILLTDIFSGEEINYPTKCICDVDNYEYFLKKDFSASYLYWTFGTFEEMIENKERLNREYIYFGLSTDRSQLKYLFKIEEINGKEYFEIQAGYKYKDDDIYIDILSNECKDLYDEIISIMADKEYIVEYDRSYSYYRYIEIEGLIEIINNFEKE